MIVKMKRMSEGAKTPSYGSAKAACFDLYACLPDYPKGIIIHPQETVKIGTGWAFQPPEGYMLQILQRSGLASKGIIPVGGIVDEDYRGEVMVLIHNGSDGDYFIHNGDKIAQMALRRYYQPMLQEADELDDTERGGNGFGSTGK